MLLRLGIPGEEAKSRNFQVDHRNPLGLCVDIGGSDNARQEFLQTMRRDIKAPQQGRDAVERDSSLSAFVLAKETVNFFV
jgi:hypothetical protein